MTIFFTRHAREKFAVLKRHKFFLTEARVREVIEKPEVIDYSRAPLFIAQRKIDRRHVLRVVFKKRNGTATVITFYPGRMNQYEKKKRS